MGVYTACAYGCMYVCVREYGGQRMILTGPSIACHLHFLR